MTAVNRIILIVFLLLAGSSTALAEKYRDERPGELLEALRALVEKAARERAADRWLQRDLEKLLERYSPRRMHELLFDDFRDGDYTSNPRWEVLEGDFKVLRRHGLVSTAGRGHARDASAPPSIEEALIGAILGGGTSPPTETRRDKGSNIIRLKADIPNEFALEFALRIVPDSVNRFDIVLAQTPQQRYGYRLRVRTGRGYRAKLFRISRGRETLLYETDLPADMDDGRRHDLSWRHRRNGQLDVLVDGQPLMSLRESRFRDGYPWLLLEHKRGEMALRAVRLSGF